jgi:hypothetical protein
MEIFKKNVRVPLLTAIIIFTIIFAGIAAYILYWEPDNGKLNNFWSGILTGLIVAIVQLFLSWYEYKEIDKFRKMLVVDIKADRDDRPFYHSLIKNAKTRISIMGVTSNRFIQDFADLNSSRDESRVLLKAMENGVEVKILIPDPTFLENDKQKDEAKHTKEALDKISQQYPTKFSVKYFNHPPAHSIFILDGQCILGPVFPGISSKDTPAVQLLNTSPYAAKYLEYYEVEWSKY